MKSWRVWLVGLTCAMGWMSAIVTYLIQWQIGWFFGLIMIGVMGSVWIAELDLRDLHRVQVIQLERQLKEAQESTADRQQKLEGFYVYVRKLTNDFLGEDYTCKRCGSKSIWFFTRYKFYPGLHRHGCQVAELRSLIEPPDLWIPHDFQPKYLEEKWLASSALMNNPAFADFFAPSKDQDSES